jgi:hypothetical protein
MAIKDIENMREDEVLSCSTEDILEQLRTKYSFDFPSLHQDDAYRDEENITREVSNRHDYFSGYGAGTRTITQKQVIFHVPFSGDKDIFHFEPSQRSIPGPQAEVRGSELLIRIIIDGKTGEQIKSLYLSTLNEINKHLDFIRRDLGNIYAHIEPPCREKIKARKAEVLKNRDILASIDIPMKRRVDAPVTYRAPEVRRKIAPVRAPVSTTGPFKPEPVLDEAEYKHILDVLDNMTKTMELSPQAFVGIGEEALRFNFLVTLNSHYQGTATGETFNYGGKTDILIKSGGKNIFIAECKFWHGEKGLLETVDQLLSYLSWRDTKTAVMIFNRNKNLSGVLETIKTAMEKHPHKKRGPAIEGPTRFRYVMGNPGDHNREVIMTVMVYDIPTEET